MIYPSVHILSFANILENSSFPLALDMYQRGFVWSEEQVSILHDDLVAYAHAPTPDVPYYMGTLLLHECAEKRKRFIIDGQQRMTALCLLYQHINGHFPPGQDLRYSAASAGAISAVLHFLQLHFPKDTEPKLESPIFENIHFTVITVSDVDMAFSFFDTQNSRGVRLETTDLLKAFHLRAIAQCSENTSRDMSLGLQDHCAQRWENLQTGTGHDGQQGDRDFAPRLFELFLWRARRWQANKRPLPDQTLLLDEFQKQAWPAQQGPETVALYRSRANMLAKNLVLSAQGELSLQTGGIIPGTDAGKLPFSIRQPIQQGVGFFLYADKYSSLYKDIFEKSLHEYDYLNRVLKCLIHANQKYIIEIFELAVLVYVDQFGKEDLNEFALRLEFLLGALRLSQDRIVKETAQKFFSDIAGEKLNLLDVMTQACHPRQVTRYLKNQAEYCRQTYHDDQTPPNGTVKGRYKQAVLTFFKKKEESLADKKAWVEAEIGNPHAGG